VGSTCHSLSLFFPFFLLPPTARTWLLRAALARTPVPRVALARTAARRCQGRISLERRPCSFRTRPLASPARGYLPGALPRPQPPDLEQASVPAAGDYIGSLTHLRPARLALSPSTRPTEDVPIREFFRGKVNSRIYVVYSISMVECPYL
jgi:hypothetical protein